MEIFLWIVCYVVIYIFIAGTLRKPFALVSAKSCKECYDGVHHWTTERGYARETPTAIHHGETGSIQAALWPFVLPWTAGSMITGSDRKQKKLDKAETRRADEIAEAKHQAELAKIRADEDAQLTRQLQDK